METARRFITAIRRGDLECRSSGIPRGKMAAAVTAPLAICVLLFVPAVFAQPASDSLGELLVGLCENSSARRARRNISKKLRAMESNRAPRTMFDILLENCIFYISQLYEFSHRLGQDRLSEECPRRVRFTCAP